MIGENGDPMDGWVVEPRCCPFESCAICGPEPVTIPPNVILATE